MSDINKALDHVRAAERLPFLNIQGCLVATPAPIDTLPQENSAVWPVSIEHCPLSLSRAGKQCRKVILW